MKQIIYITLILFINIWLSASVNGQGELINPIGQTDIFGVIHAITNFLMWVGAPIAVIIILYGAFQLITAAGNPEKIEGGKRAIWWAIAGIVIILLGYGITAVVANFFGYQGDVPPPVSPE